MPSCGPPSRLQVRLFSSYLKSPYLAVPPVASARASGSGSGCGDGTSIDENFQQPYLTIGKCSRLTDLLAECVDAA